MFLNNKFWTLYIVTISILAFSLPNNREDIENNIPTLKIKLTEEQQSVVDDLVKVLIKK